MPTADRTTFTHVSTTEAMGKVMVIVLVPLPVSEAGVRTAPRISMPLGMVTSWTVTAAPVKVIVTVSPSASL